MKQYQSSDFDLFCKKAHIQILLLHWITDRLAGRQHSGNPSIDRIELDFMQHCAKLNQNADFRFDRDDTPLMVAQPLIVSGVEAVERHSDSSEIVSKIETELGNYASIEKGYDLKISILTCLKNEQQRSTWTVMKRLRNSLSHFRWEYYSDTGRIVFLDQLNGKETARFSMEFV